MRTVLSRSDADGRGAVEKFGSDSKAVKKDRLDNLLVVRGLVQSREKAKALISAGKVLVENLKMDKPGTQVQADARDSIDRGWDSPM